MTFQEWLGRGRTAGRDKDYQEAIRCFQHALIERPDHTESMTLLGIAYFLKGDSKKALQKLRESLSIDSNQPMARHYLSMCTHNNLAYSRTPETEDDYLFGYDPPTQRNVASSFPPMRPSNANPHLYEADTKSFDVNVNISRPPDAGMSTALAVISLIFAGCSFIMCPILFTPIAVICGSEKINKMRTFENHCPVCAAKYNEFVIHDPQNARLQLLDSFSASQSCQASLALGEETALIRFVEGHAMDLRTVIEATRDTEYE